VLQRVNPDVTRTARLKSLMEHRRIDPGGFGWHRAGGARLRARKQEVARQWDEARAAARYAEPPMAQGIEKQQGVSVSLPTVGAIKAKMGFSKKRRGRKSALTVTSAKYGYLAIENLPRGKRPVAESGWSARRRRPMRWLDWGNQKPRP